MKAQLDGVTGVDMEYIRWLPAGSALIKFYRPDYIPASVQKLKGLTIAGFPVNVEELDEEHLAKHKEFVRQQPQFSGTGPNANTTNLEEKVVLWGLTPRWSISDVARLLQPYQLYKQDEGANNAIHFTPIPEQTHSKKFVVRMADAEEAHRLVRDLHMTPVPPLQGITPPPAQFLRARVLAP